MEIIFYKKTKMPRWDVREVASLDVICEKFYVREGRAKADCLKYCPNGKYYKETTWGKQCILYCLWHRTFAISFTPPKIEKIPPSMQLSEWSTPAFRIKE